MEECSRFPNAEHDDQVDAMTQGLNKLIFKCGRRRRRKDKSIEDMFLSGIMPPAENFIVRVGEIY